MSRDQIIAAICRINRTADAAFLGAFTDAQLDEYLQRLTLIHDRRGRESVWIRRNPEPAIVGPFRSKTPWARPAA